MRERKIRAGYVLLRERASLRRELLFIKLLYLCIFICALMLRGCVFSGDGYFSGAFPIRGILMISSALGGLAFVYFYFAHRLYFSGRIYGLGSREISEPGTLMRFGAVVRFIVLWGTIRLIKLLWLMFFMSPAVFLLFLVLRTLLVGGEIQRMMLYSLIAVSLILSAVGAGFYFYVSGRYYLVELLFVRNPRQNVLEAVKSSGVFTGKSLFRTALFRIRCALRGGGVYGRMLRAVYCCELFYGKDYFSKEKARGGFTFPEPS